MWLAIEFRKLGCDWTWLTRALLGLWIFHHLLGGVWTPPSISAPTHRRAIRKTAFESSLKIILKLLRSFLSSGQNWGHQKSKGQIWPNWFFAITSLFLKIEQWFWLYRVCLVKARRITYNFILTGQGQLLTLGQGKLSSLCDPSRSKYTLFDAPCRDERNHQRTQLEGD